MAKSLLMGIDILMERNNEFIYPLLMIHGKKDAVTNHHDSIRFCENAGRYSFGNKLIKENQTV